MVMVVRAKDGVVVSAEPDGHFNRLMKHFEERGITAMGTQSYADMLERDGWKLVTVLAIQSDRYDRELWFRKD